MKVNLLRNNEDIVAGFINVDPFGDPSKVTVGDVENLDWLIEDGQCKEFIARDIIDYIQPDKIDSVLMGWVKKLRHGGVITIGGNDLFLITKEFYLGGIDGNEATSLLFGSRNNAINYRKNLTSLENIVRFFESQSLKIIKKSYDTNTYSYIVTGQRP